MITRGRAVAKLDGGQQQQQLEAPRTVFRIYTGEAPALYLALPYLGIL